MKKILSLVLSVILVVSLFPSRNVFAVGEFTIRGTDASVFPGEQVSVDIMLENNPGISAINLYYIFDADYFKLTKVENKVSSFNMTHVTTTVWDAASDFTDDAVLGTLCFDVAENTPAGEYEVEIMFLSASNDEFEEVFAQTISATVVVQEIGCSHAAKREVPAKSATCEKGGNRRYYVCDSCGLVLKADGVTETTVAAEQIPALGHSFTNYVSDGNATCTEDGTKTAVCDRCDAENTVRDTGSATGHHYEGSVTAPTCTERGYTTYTCECGDSYIADEVSALGHDWKGTACSRCDVIRANPFNDVSDDSFYINPVLWAVENGITTGATSTTFNPNGACLRAHVVTFLHRTAGNPAPTSDKNPFADVKTSDFFYEPVLWAVEKGITNGTSATTFGSFANCNRAAVVTFLWRASGSPEPQSTSHPFVDVKTTDFFYKPVLWAVENGITNGVDATHFGPTSDCNRAQVVTFLYRTANQLETTSSIKVAALETAYGSEVWAEVAAAFTAKTGIQVELVVDRNLEDVVTGPMQRAEFPDVIHLPTGRPAHLTEEMARVNAMHPLTNALNMTIPGESVTPADKIIPGFTDNRIVAPHGDGVTYMAPMFYSPCGLFYNANLFEEKGWDVPTTWSQMWALGDLAAAEGISLFTYPTVGYYDTFMFALMNTIGGNEFFDSITTYEEGAWDSLNGRTLLSIMDKLTDYTHPNTVVQANNQDFYKNQQMGMDGRALFMPNGTWIVGEMADYASVIQDFEWGMTAIPTAGKSPAAFSWFEQTWIPASAENIDGAELFVAFLYSDEAAEIFASAGAMQPILGLSDMLEGETAMFYSIYDNGARAAVGGFAPFVDIPGVDIYSTFFTPIDNLTAGTMTIEEYADLVKTHSALMRENILPY